MGGGGNTTGPRFCRGSRALRPLEVKSCPPNADGPPKSPVSELKLNVGRGLPKRCAVARARDRIRAKHTAKAFILAE